MMAALLALSGCPSPAADPRASDAGASDIEAATTSSSATTTVGTATTNEGSTSSPTTGGASSGDGTTAAGASATTGGGTGGDTTMAAATTTATTGADTTGGTTGAPPEPPPWEPRGCPDIYKQDLLPTFELTIAPSVLSQLKDEWAEANDENKPDHPLQRFRYEDIEITSASIRLRGNDKWWAEQKKMQFEVSFNTYDKSGRFMGLKHVLFDAARYNESFLRDRLALKILRDVGVPAPCANNARLVLNGDYYGLFTSIEKVDSEFLERWFEEPNGDLYKRANWEKKTNEDDKDDSHLEALLDADTVKELDAVMNLDEAILEWAAEAVLPDADGAWAGGLNYYVYDDPKTGFNVIPWDLDATFDRLPADTDPYVYLKPNDWGRPFYAIATKDPGWFGKYVEAIAFVLAQGYDVPTLQARIDAWAAQIAEAAASDPNKPFSTQAHLDAVKAQRSYVAARAAFVKKWLKCWQDGGTKGEDGKCDPP